ncbi:MAG: amino acid ABC transporter permease [Oscillospiraceae bacterium]|jgi:putative glutamine transport system permease protein|nr:amino acid ABC transporter permease [Oscillospiraceae bacterium]
MMRANGPFALFKWEALLGDFPFFLEGLLYTFVISLSALLLALALGIVFGLLSSAAFPPARAAARVYVEFFQNTPLLIQVFFLYNGLPFLGLVLDVTTIGILGVGLYHGAYITEVVRAGIGSVGRGQREAALSQGLAYSQMMGYIVLPQAVRVMLPPLTMQAVNLIKNTSVVAIIAGSDIMFAANSWSSGNLYYGPAYVAAGVLYFCLCFPLAKLASYLERRAKQAFGQADPGQADAAATRAAAKGAVTGG